MAPLFQIPACQQSCEVEGRDRATVNGMYVGLHHATREVVLAFFFSSKFALGDPLAGSRCSFVFEPCTRACALMGYPDTQMHMWGRAEPPKGGHMRF